MKLDGQDPRPFLLTRIPELTYAEHVARAPHSASTRHSQRRCDVIRALDAEQPVADVRTMESLSDLGGAGALQLGLLLTIFAVVAAAGQPGHLRRNGLFGRAAHARDRRRMALGAAGGTC